MNFRQVRPAILLAIALPALAAAAPKPAPVPGLILIETESRLEIDAAGKVVSVQTTPALPAFAAAVVEGNLRKMQFTAPLKDGHAVGGVTYAWQQACAAPDAGSYRFAVKYIGNGPSLDRSVAPVYPREAERRGVTSTWKVTLLVDADGKGHLLSAQRNDDGERSSNDFQGAIRRWAESVKFRPEQLDGKAVATQVSTEVQFVLGGPTRKQAETARQGSDACRLALDASAAERHEVALDSPFKPLPAN